MKCLPRPAYACGVLPLASAVVLALVLPVAAAAAALDPAKLPGLVCDETAAERSDGWRASTISKPYVGEGYLVADPGSEKWLKYKFQLAEAGSYHLLFFFTPNTNRTTKATFVVPAQPAEQTVVVNERTSPLGPCGFHSVGKFELAKGEFTITLSNAGADGYLVADALLLVTGEQFARLNADPNSLAAAMAPAPAKKPAPPPSTKEPAAPAKPVEPAPAFVRPKAARPLQTISSQELDEMLARQLGGIEAAELVGDEEFLRRVSLGLIGRPPTLQERSQFAADSAADKRSRTIDRLLASPEFGRQWANYWTDAIRFRIPDPELTFLNYEPFRGWLAASFHANQGWDEITYQILTAQGKVEENPQATFLGFHQGDRARVAGETTRLFLGVHISCAECHDHPFEALKQETFHRFAAYFARTEAKVPQNSSNGTEVKGKNAGEHKLPGKNTEMLPAAFEAASLPAGATDLERRVQLANWVVSPDNPYFAKAFVNRTWSHLMGRGFCEPVDDVSASASPELPEVFEAVSVHFAASGHNVQDLVRLIANTQAFQRRLAASEGEEAKPFARAIAARLRGDEVFDSLSAALDLPNLAPPQAKPTATVRFPPPPKSTRDLVNDAFAFDPSLGGDSRRRTMPQAMFLMNNAQVQRQVDARTESDTMLAKLLAAEPDDAAAVRGLYQRLLARSPHERELEIALAHVRQAPERAAAFEDLLWCLLNSAEFTTRK